MKKPIILSEQKLSKQLNRFISESDRYKETQRILGRDLMDAARKEEAKKKRK
jgi:hypothetical protein